MSADRELLRRAALALRMRPQTLPVLIDPTLTDPLAALLDSEAELYAPNKAALAVARAVLREDG